MSAAFILLVGACAAVLIFSRHNSEMDKFKRELERKIQRLHTSIREYDRGPLVRTWSRQDGAGEIKESIPRSIDVSSKVEGLKQHFLEVNFAFLKEMQTADDDKVRRWIDDTTTILDNGRNEASSLLDRLRETFDVSPERFRHNPSIGGHPNPYSDAFETLHISNNKLIFMADTTRGFPRSEIEGAFSVDLGHWVEQLRAPKNANKAIDSDD